MGNPGASDAYWVYTSGAISQVYQKTIRYNTQTVQARVLETQSPINPGDSGGPVVNDACAAALDLGVADYRFVRRYLERHAPVPLTLRQVDPLIRELTHYRDVIARKTQEVTP